MIYYAIRYGVEVTALRIIYIESVKPCGPLPIVDLTHYIWSTFEYYCANYAMIVLPSHTSDNKIVYAHHYRAEIGGETSRLCGQCVTYALLRTLARIMILAVKTLKSVLRSLLQAAPSLNSAASEIVFGLGIKQKFRFHNITTCKPFEIF